MTSTEPDLLDVLWLLAHPGWTWAGLQSTPADVIELMTQAETIRANTVVPK